MKANATARKQQIPIESFFTTTLESELERDSTADLQQSLSQIRQNVEKIQDVQRIMKTFDEKETVELCVTVRDEVLNAFSERTITSMIVDVAAPFFKKAGRLILVGEHSDEGRWHYHGMLEGLSNDARNKLKRGLKRALGITTLRGIKYWNSYTEYITKSYIKSSRPEHFDNREHLYLVGLKVRDVIKV